MKVTLNGEFEFEPARCPVTGMSVWPVANCRCHHCRPDLHWYTNAAAVMPTAHTWPLINTTGTNIWPPPVTYITYTIGAGQ